jgi:hypothetical protein
VTAEEIGIWVVFVFGGVLAYWILRSLGRARSDKANQLRDAQKNYRDLLELLKQHPTDPNVRERALAWGRHYSNLTRQGQGVAIFDEVALANDINAACAGAAQRPTTAPSPREASTEDRLSRLQDLFTKGIITEDEYQTRRARFLDEI